MVIPLTELNLGTLHLGRWLEDRNFAPQGQVQGRLRLATCPDPVAYERGNDLKMLSGPRGLP